MILADKIVSLRKKAGWSQEELAAQLNVTRQSVSKWEGAQSMPDMDKVVQMSRLFGVTTDYLLKDEIEEAAPDVGAEASESTLRRVSMEDAAHYIELRRAAAPKLALATFLCVISPIALLLLAAFSQQNASGITENMAAGVGLCVLLVLVAAGVTLFLSCAAQAKDFEFLTKEPFETEYGVSGMVKERREQYRPQYYRLISIGTALCILSAAPMFAVMGMGESDIAYVSAICALLLIVGVGAMAFVYGGTYQSALDQLLEEGDYTRREKAKSGVRGAVSVIYWLAATAIYLLCTFTPVTSLTQKTSWIIWAVAGVLYGAVMMIVRLCDRRGRG